MWREHLRLQELYNEVRQELKDLVDYSELRSTGEINRRLTFVAFAGFVIAVLSLVAGVFGMNKPSDINWLTGVVGSVATVLAIGLYCAAKYKKIF